MRYISALAALITLFFSSYSYSDQIPEEDVSKARLTLGPDRWIQFHYFLQTNFNYTKLDSDKSYDFQIRKSRIVLNGQVASNVDFFMQTEDLKPGNSSDDSETDNNTDGANKLYTHDAFIRVKLDRAFQVYGGLLAIPLTRNNLSSEATSLCATENSHLSVLSNYSNNGRDAGVMIRGILFTRGLEYRAGVFQGYSRDAKGVSGRNSSDSPRLSGRISWNAFENEDDESYFYSENYLGKKNILNFGAGIDYQRKVCPTEEGTFKDYLAFSADASVDLSFASSSVLTLQGGFVMSTNNPADGLGDLDGDGNIDTVPLYKKFSVLHAQAGFLAFGKIQPVARFSYRKNEMEDEKTVKYMTLSGGMNYFINSHYAAVKLLYTHPLKDSVDKDGKKLDLSLQIYM